MPNDDRHFPGRFPIHISGFREKPKEWIVDRIIMHNGKGQDSKFLILWKAGDKTWAIYHKVAQLNILDWYCEFMGVKEASELPTNYVSKDPESESENEENNIHVSSCKVNYKDIRENKGTKIPINHPHSTQLATSTLPPDNMDHRECNHPALTFQTISSNSIYMLAQTLDTIIRAIRQCVPTPKERIVTHHMPYLEPPCQPCNYRPGGRGGATQANRRGDIWRGMMDLPILTSPGTVP